MYACIRYTDNTHVSQIVEPRTPPNNHNCHKQNVKLGIQYIIISKQGTKQNKVIPSYFYSISTNDPQKTRLSYDKKQTNNALQTSPPSRRKNAIQQGALRGHRNSIRKEAQNHLVLRDPVDMVGKVKVKKSSALPKIRGSV